MHSSLRHTPGGMCALTGGLLWRTRFHMPPTHTRTRMAPCCLHKDGLKFVPACLHLPPHRAASAKWCAGKLSLAATLTGHTGPVTCLDIIDSTVVTGSADGTARVWDLRRGVQLHVLHMPAAAAVVAVALASVSLAVTATARNGVLLWRGATPLRRFEAMPVRMKRLQMCSLCVCLCVYM